MSTHGCSESELGDIRSNNSSRSRATVHVASARRQADQRAGTRRTGGKTVDADPEDLTIVKVDDSHCAVLRNLAATQRDQPGHNSCPQDTRKRMPCKVVRRLRHNRRPEYIAATLCHDPSWVLIRSTERHPSARPDEATLPTIRSEPNMENARRLNRIDAEIAIDKRHHHQPLCPRIWRPLSPKSSRKVREVRSSPHVCSTAPLNPAAHLGSRLKRLPFRGPCLAAHWFA